MHLKVLNAFRVEDTQAVEGGQQTDAIKRVRITESWLREYNEERPHDSLGRVPAVSFMPRRATVRESTSELYP